VCREIHLGAMIDYDWRSKYLEAVDLWVIDMKAVNQKAVYLEEVNLEAVYRKVCAIEAETLLIT
jgi:hypothetical protein